MTFEVAGAADYAGEGYDLVAFFDAFHDLGDPLAAARHAARRARAGRHAACSSSRSPATRVEENLNPIGRLYYGFSTLVLHARLAVAARPRRARHAGRRGARCAEVLRAGRVRRRSAARPRRR